MIPDNISTLPILVLALPGHRASDLLPLHIYSTVNSSGRGVPRTTPAVNPSAPFLVGKLLIPCSAAQTWKHNWWLTSTAFKKKKPFWKIVIISEISVPPLVLWLSRSCAGGTWLPQEQHSSFPAYHQHSQTQLWLLLWRPFTVPLTVQHKLRLHSIQACLLTQF